MGHKLLNVDAMAPILIIPVSLKKITKRPLIILELGGERTKNIFINENGDIG